MFGHVRQIMTRLGRLRHAVALFGLDGLCGDRLDPAGYAVAGVGKH